MPQLDPSHPLAKLLKRDTRFKMDAYFFVFESLEYAHKVLGLGQERPRDNEQTESPPAKNKKKVERHLTGQQLCEAIRQFALDQYGLMAKSVLNSWGVKTTGDFGSIVFNLIEAGQMKKTKHDCIDDFDEVFDFDEAFVRGFKIKLPTVSTE
ncbi:MAG: hypothetical protein IT427_14800 [Pirellulales bacterium]|nr:hypothetical protein [Pirellulales bacterium]